MILMWTIVCILLVAIIFQSAAGRDRVQRVEDKLRDLDARHASLGRRIARAVNADGKLLFPPEPVYTTGNYPWGGPTSGIPVTGIGDGELTIVSEGGTQKNDTPSR